MKPNRWLLALRNILLTRSRLIYPREELRAELAGGILEVFGQVYPLGPEHVKALHQKHGCKPAPADLVAQVELVVLDADR